MITTLQDRQLIRAEARSTRYVLLRLNAPQAPPRADRTPVNVSIVLDRSGSMGGDRKFPVAREAVEQALRMLRAEDRFSLVVYDEHVDTLMSSTRATADAKRRALDALASVRPRGSTDLGAGWLTGCEQIGEFANERRVSRCLLLTDGLANHGITDRGELARHAAELRRRSVATSTFGVGSDFDERLLRDMAQQGGGHAYFIERTEQITDLLTSELGEALEVTVPRARIVVRPNGREEVEVLNSFTNERVRARNEYVVELGDLVSGQELDVVFAVRFPRGEEGNTASVVLELHSAGAMIFGAGGAPQWIYASHLDNDTQPRNTEVDRAVAELYAARARAEATEANREGDFERARRVLEGTSRRISEYAGSDRELRGLARSLREDVKRYAEAPMPAMAMKMAFYQAEVRTKGRAPGGRARRGT